MAIDVNLIERNVASTAIQKAGRNQRYIGEIVMYFDRESGFQAGARTFSLDYNALSSPAEFSFGCCSLGVREIEHEIFHFVAGHYGHGSRVSARIVERKFLLVAQKFRGNIAIRRYAKFGGRRLN